MLENPENYNACYCGFSTIYGILIAGFIKQFRLLKSMDNKKAEQIYDKIKENLEDGKIVAIEPESGDYFLGEDVDEACDKVKERYPDREFLLKRVGARAVYRIL